MTFDWTDVADAASYQIQVDDVSAFGEPFLILNQHVNPSVFTTSALPDSPWFWFWRVRAISSAGIAGPWSQVRMIDVDSTPPPPATTSTLPPASTTTTSTLPAATSTTSPPATTTTSPPSGPLPAPTQLTPANDARFSPGQTVTFDWSDVDGAASYTLQIDDSESFAAPFVVNQTVSASQQTVSGLPTTRMWWRVRANDGNGVPGNWSPGRRFELKN